MPDRGGARGGRRCHSPAVRGDPRSTIEKLKKCKTICRYGTGVDIVDVEAAYQHEMVVTSVPDYALDEVAKHTIALALMLTRRLPWYDCATHAGRWHWSESKGPIARFRIRGGVPSGLGALRSSRPQELTLSHRNSILYNIMRVIVLFRML
jgi:D-3-phosphoglycerate dehydrogenase